MSRRQCHWSSLCAYDLYRTKQVNKSTKGLAGELDTLVNMIMIRRVPVITVLEITIYVIEAARVSASAASSWHYNRVLGEVNRRVLLLLLLHV